MRALLAEAGWAQLTSFFPRPIREYVYVAGERIAVLKSTATGYLGASKAYVVSDGSVGYFLNDHLGAPFSILDSLARVEWRAERQPFGAVKILSGGNCTPPCVQTNEQVQVTPILQTAHPYPSTSAPPITVKKPAGAATFAISFSGFRTEQCADLVTIEDPATTPPTVLATYSGSGPTGTGSFTTAKFSQPSLLVRLTPSDTFNYVEPAGCTPTATCASQGGTCTRGTAPKIGSYYGFRIEQVLAYYNGSTNNLRLPGQYYDGETGLHYNWNRYYEPSTGRYVTPEPLATNSLFAEFMSQSKFKVADSYAYGFNSPAATIDRDGRFAQALPIVEAAGAAVAAAMLAYCLANPKACAIPWPLFPEPPRVEIPPVRPQEDAETRADPIEMCPPKDNFCYCRCIVNGKLEKSPFLPSYPNNRMPDWECRANCLQNAAGATGSSCI